MGFSDLLQPLSRETPCAYCGAITSIDVAILDVEGWRCGQCQQRSALAISQGADEQFGSISRQAMEKKGRQVGVRAAIAGVASAGSIGALSWLFMQPSDAAQFIFYAVFAAFVCVVMFGFELASYRRIRNGLKQMQLPEATVRPKQS
jgi:hypothetical protein